MIPAFNALNSRKFPLVPGSAYIKLQSFTTATYTFKDNNLAVHMKREQESNGVHGSFISISIQSLVLTCAI